MLDPYIGLAPLLLLPIAGMLKYIGCGAPFTSGDPDFEKPSIYIEPESANLLPGEQETFTAYFSSGHAIDNPDWSPNVETHDGKATYTAPDIFQPLHTTDTVTATALGLNASVTVTLEKPDVTVIPPSVTLLPGEDQPFKVDPDQPVTWDIDPLGLGEITPEGKYTAGPYKIGSDKVKVKATNQADETGWATVTLIGNAAEFVPPPDTATLGNWQAAGYGTEGWALAHADPSENPNYNPDNIVKLPDYLPALDLSPLPVYIFEDPTLKSQGLQKPDTNERLADAWFGDTIFDLKFDFTDLKTHLVAIYCVDWTDQGRAQTFEFFDDSQTPATLLDTQPLSGFGGGQYLVWQLVGKVRMRVTKTAGPNFVISGIFFG